MRSKEEIYAILDRFASVDEDYLSLGAEGVMDALYWVVDEQKSDSEVEQYLPREARTANG
jgi:hypothetical protein